MSGQAPRPFENFLQEHWIVAHTLCLVLRIKMVWQKEEIKL